MPGPSSTIRVAQREEETTEHSAAIANAALAIGDGFLVAWRPTASYFNAEPGISLTRLDVNGRALETIVLGAAGSSFVNLARTATGVVAAWDGGQAGVEMVWLGPDGRPRNDVSQKAVGISAGSGNDAYRPSLAARGDLVAASWRVREGSRTFVAATDPTGAVSPAVEVGAGQFPDDSALAADDAGFIAAYGTRGYPSSRPSAAASNPRPHPTSVLLSGWPPRARERPTNG
jgi:hypothetical protein